MIFVGDLSRADRDVLATLAGAARRIVEFGAGGSTQIFAQCAPAGADIASVETDPAWIERTQAILTAIGAGAPVRFLSYEAWIAANEATAPGAIDLAFDDGVPELRPDFARRIWSRLACGGVLAFHDTRRAIDAGNVFAFCAEHYADVRSVEVNVGGSNISLVRKQVPLAYADWNKAERRSKLDMGYGAMDETLRLVERQRAAG